MDLVLIQLLNAFQYGLLIFLVASGLTLLLGVMNIINLAHGSFYMMGAYLLFVINKYTGNIYLSAIAALIASGIVGLMLERSLFRRFYGAEHLQQVVLTYGIILIFESLRSRLVDDEVHVIKIPQEFDFSVQLGSIMSYPFYRLIVSVICLVVAAGLFLLINKTNIGAKIRAGAISREMTELLGIDIKRLYSWIFGLGVILAAYAGMVNAPISTIFPGMGFNILIVSFVAVIVGGIGSIWGVLASSQLIAIIDTFAKIWIPEAGGMAIFLVMAIVLIIRPTGLTGHRE